MRVTTIHGVRDIRVEQRPEPEIEQPTDAIVRVTAACICGSDLWPYRGENEIQPGSPIGHEVVGVIEETGAGVRDFAAGDFVLVPFCHCDNTCPNCQAGVQSACLHGAFTSGGQGEYVRVVHADGSLVKLPEAPGAELVPSLLALTDVMATGWHAAVQARVREGATAVVVGDGAVGLCGVLAASVMGAERVIAMSRHEPRQALARRFGATDVVVERGDDGVAVVNELTGGVGADAVLECVGTGGSMKQALKSARAGAMVGFVGVPHGVELPVPAMFARNVGVQGGVAPVRRYLPELLELVSSGRIEPGLVFDMRVPLEQVADGYRAMDERRAIKVLVEV